jgi:hypothetical protein
MIFINTLKSGAAGFECVDKYTRLNPNRAQEVVCQPQLEHGFE